MSLVRLFFSVEFFYVMFLFAGVFKTSLGLPFDLSAAFLGLTLLACFRRVAKKPSIHKYAVAPLGLAFGLLLIALVSGLIGGFQGEAVSKTIKLVALTLPTFILPFVFVRNKESIVKVIASIGVLSLVLSLFALPMITGNDQLFVGFNNGNYQGLARVTGIGFISLVFMLFWIKSRKRKIAVAISMLVVLVVLFSAGSRIPLIAIGLLVFWALIKGIKIVKGDVLISKKLIPGLGIVALLTFAIPYLYSKGYFQTIVYRFQVLFAEGGGTSAMSRVDRINSAFDMFKENLVFGGGFGNFGEYYRGTDGLYAHNMILEFMSEMGVLGIAWLLLFVMTLIYHAALRPSEGDKPIKIAVVAGALFFFVNAMVSGDINDNRPFLAFAALVMILPHIKSRDKLNAV